MSKAIREHIRSNVVGYIAIFMFAIGGTAYATHPGGANTISSGDIINDNVNTADVRDDTLPNGGLQAVDLRPDSVGSSEVAPDSLDAADLNAASVTSSEVAPDSLGAADLNAASVTSSEVALNAVGTGAVADGSLTRNDISESSLFTMNARGGGECDPTSTTFIICDGVTVNLPVQSDVLVVASASFGGHGVGQDTGVCKLSRGTTDFATLSDGIAIGQFRDEHQLGGATLGDGFSRTGVDLNVPAGTTTWNLRCNELNSDIVIGDIQVSAFGFAN